MSGRKSQSSSSHFERLVTIFEEVRLAPIEEREAILTAACDGNAELEAEVRGLLEHHASDSHALDELPFNPADFKHLTAAWKGGPTPERIGRYRICDVIGRGGMGVVYRAEQDQPRRDVAIKVIRQGVVSRELLHRFDVEVAVLGRLEHPGIARIYEAGMFDTGEGAQPYFAMEFIDGQPLHTFCKEHALDLEDQLRLFIQICDAVQHAHQKGIIHRDLKPGNILVTGNPADANMQCKILDFGVARATDADLQVTTLHTQVGVLVGTLTHMSPEQVDGRSDALDTRSDVYSLGVLLYEMIAGCLPYTMHDDTLARAARRIIEDEPIPLTTISPHYRGDLNTITLKALAKDPDRRYQAAHGLAADVRRFLDHEPITARPATTMYRMRKFAMRNKALVTGAALTVIALVAGIIGTTIGMVQAQRETERATAVSDFMTDILTQAQLAEAGPNVKLADALRGAAETVDERFKQYPDNRRIVHTILGSAFQQLGLFRDALPHVKRAYEEIRALKGPTHESTIEAAAACVFVYKQLGRIDEGIEFGNAINNTLAPAEQNSRTGFKLRRTMTALASTKPEHKQAAVAELDELYETVRATFGDADELTADFANDLSQALEWRALRGESDDQAADLERSAELLFRCVMHLESFDWSPVEQLRTRANLAETLAWLERTDEAEAEAHAVLELAETQLNSDHYIFGIVHLVLANVAMQRRDVNLCAEHLVARAELSRRLETDQGVMAVSNMSDALPYMELAGMHELGETYARLVIDGMQGIHDDRISTQKLFLARFLSAQGQRDEAMQILREIEADMHESDPYPLSLYCLFHGENSLAEGDQTAALDWFAKAHRYRIQIVGTERTSLDAMEVERIEEAIRRATAQR
ncbi:MAG: protein kinase domain-containing protein [Phycisphaerales bacterium]